VDVKIIKAIGAILIIGGIVCCSVYPLAYGYIHEELTYMQVVKKTFCWIFIGGLALVVGFAITEIDYLR